MKSCTPIEHRVQNLH